jgi:DNA repair protein RecO
MNSENPPLHGIIIRVWPSGDADLVLRVLTQEQGKISCIAKHARKSKRRFGTSFDVLDRGVFELGPSRGTLSPVRSFVPEISFRAIRNDIDKVALAALVCESADNLLHEGDIEPGALFETIALGLEAIDQSASVKESCKAAFLAVSHLLQLCGFLAASRPPSANNLLLAVEEVERAAERPLQTKRAIQEIVERLKST